ncbi:MAG: acetyltransferase [Lachnotalea sp.]
MKKKLIIIGGGSHAESMIDTINSMGVYKIVGIIDTKEKQNTYVSGVKIIGEDKDLEYYYYLGIRNAAIAIGSIGKIEPRLRKYKACKKIGYQFPNIIDNSAKVSKDVVMGEGNFIGKGSIINTKVRIGNACIINTGAIIEHGGVIESFVHIAPGSVLCGNVRVEKNTHIGAHSTIIQNVAIGQGTMVGAGSLVLKDIPSNRLVFGSPVKEVTVYEQSTYDC